MLFLLVLSFLVAATWSQIITINNCGGSAARTGEQSPMYREEEAVERLEEEETARVVMGKSADQGQFPWAVALFYGDQYVCTGSIISTNEILTAAHCVIFEGVEQPVQWFHAVAGNVNRSGPGQRLEFEKITAHPDYLVKDAHDIAVLKTTQPIEFDKLVQPVCLTENYRPTIFNHKGLVAMGWGRTRRHEHSKNDKSSEILKYDSQQVVPALKCKIFFLGTNVPDSVLCATGILSGICSGDSGGPLVHFGRNEKPTQVAVASFVHGIVGCGIGPAGFEKISSHMQFIMESVTAEVCTV